MNRTSLAATTRQPCQPGRGRPHRSHSRAVPTSIPSTVMVGPVRQTVCPGSAGMRVMSGTPPGEVAAVGEEGSERFRQVRNHKSSDDQARRRLHVTEPGRNVFGDVFRRWPTPVRLLWLGWAEAPHPAALAIIRHDCRRNGGVEKRRRRCDHDVQEIQALVDRHCQIRHVTICNGCCIAPVLRDTYAFVLVYPRRRYGVTNM